MDNTKQSFASHALVLGSIALITFLLLAGVSAAVPSEEWSRTFGGNEWDRVYSVQQTSDGGIYYPVRQNLMGRVKMVPGL